jgi:hypothetical protein
MLWTFPCLLCSVLAVEERKERGVEGAGKTPERERRGAGRQHDEETTSDIGSVALFSSQIQPQILLFKKKILHHIKISANAWSTKCR